MDIDKLGLYKKQKLAKIQKELDEIQDAGKEGIVLIANRLIKELTNQGYDVKGSELIKYISIYAFEENDIQVNGLNFEIKGNVNND